MSIKHEWALIVMVMVKMTKGMIFMIYKTNLCGWIQFYDMDIQAWLCHQHSTFCIVPIRTGSPPSGRNQGNHGKCEKNLPDMEKSWNSISWEKSWKSHGNSNSGKENLFWFALQCLYYHIGRDLIKISLDPNMPCSLAEICAMTLYWL